MSNIVLVCGSRDWPVAQLVIDRLDRLDRDGLVIISGMARGVDRVAADWARARGVELVEMPAQWDRDGKAAGFRRNQEMIDLAPRLVLAFTTGSRGTAHTISLARERGIALEVHRPSRDLETSEVVGLRRRVAAAQEAGAHAYVAALRHCFTVRDFDTLRQRPPRHSPLSDRSALVDVKRCQHIGEPPVRGEREDLHVLDLLRENHILRMEGTGVNIGGRILWAESDDLLIGVDPQLGFSEDATQGVEWHLAQITGGPDRFRLAEHRGGVVTSVEEQGMLSRQEAWEAASYVARKRRTHRTPSDLELQRDPLSLTEGERIALFQADEVDAEAPLMQLQQTEPMADCTITFDLPRARRLRAGHEVLR
jgi:hypothetical protein